MKKNCNNKRKFPDYVISCSYNQTNQQTYRCSCFSIRASYILTFLIERNLKINMWKLVTIVSKILCVAAVKQFQFPVAMKIIKLSINGIVAFINLLGFIPLFKTRKNNIFFVNQKILILTLSATEILHLVNDIVALSLFYLNMSADLLSNLRGFFFSISKTLTIVYLLLNMLILTYRFFMTFFHAKYHQRCKPSITKIVICVIVLFAVLIVAPSLVMYFNRMCQLHKLYAEVYEYAYCGIEWFLMIEMPLVYVYMFWIATRKNRRSRRDFISFRYIRVPTFMVLTFVLFTVIPDQQYYYHQWIKKIHRSNHSKFYFILYRCGFLLDTIIYVCLTPAVRRNFFRLLKQCYKRAKSTMRL